MHRHRTGLQLDRLVGLAMLIIASTVFAYYTVWTLLMVCTALTPLTGTEASAKRGNQARRNEEYKDLN